MDIDQKTRDLLQNVSKRRAWIIYQLALQDQTLASIARSAGVSRQAIWQALVKPYPRAEKVIAQHLGIEPQTLFPERYNLDGQPNRKRGRPNKQ